MANNEPNEQAKIIETNYLKNLDFDFSGEVIKTGRTLFSQSVRFIAASNNMKSLPEESIPEVAFAGRSNVGKSSLIIISLSMDFSAATASAILKSSSLSDRWFNIIFNSPKKKWAKAHFGSSR